MKSAGLPHFRYTDDIRIFTKTAEEARRALVAITRLLRERGLTLQSGKTKIRTTAEAREEIDGVMPVIEALHKGYVDEVIAAGLMAADVSVPTSVIDDLVGEGDVPAAVLHRAFDSYVKGEPRPNKSMFNYLLRRLGRIADLHALNDCWDRFSTNPELTPSIMRYVTDIDGSADLELQGHVDTALRLETSAIYPYQRYLLLDWLNRRASTLADSTLGTVRAIAIRSESPPYVKAVATELLGKFGTHSDLDEIEARYKRASDPLAKAQLLCSLQRLEKSRRNGIAKRVGKDGGWLGRAAKLVREDRGLSRREATR